MEERFTSFVRVSIRNLSGGSLGIVHRPAGPRILNGPSGRRVLSQQSLGATAPLRNLPLDLRYGERLFGVDTTHRRAAAFGKRTSNGGFPAVNPRSRRSEPDPYAQIPTMRMLDE